MSEIQLAGCSVAGPAHETADVPCQDSWYGYRLPGSKFVVAVGDGLGSASHSHLGSRLATRLLADELREFALEEPTLTEQPVEEAMKESFAAVRGELVKEANRLNLPVNELNTTLLATVAGPSGGGAAAVGDGGIVGHADDGHFLMIPREDTEYASHTTPVTSDRWTDSYRFGYREGLDAAAVFTDGLDPFVWDGQTAPRERFFDQVFGFTRSAQNSYAATESLCEFLDDDHFREYSGDDKTIAVGMVVPDIPRSELSYCHRIANSLAEHLHEQTRF